MHTHSDLLPFQLMEGTLSTNELWMTPTVPPFIVHLTVHSFWESRLIHVSDITPSSGQHSARGTILERCVDDLLLGNRQGLSLKITTQS